MSLLKIISDSLEGGRLPDGFSLPREGGEDGGIAFADGAMDGIGLYHMGPQEPEEDDRRLMEEAVLAAGSRDFRRADESFRALSQKVRALSLVEGLSSFVMDHKDEVDADALYDYALTLIRDSDGRECVKYGLILLSLFKTDGDEAVKQAVQTLALSDEFTPFALFAMMEWTDGNEAIFELAKKVRGWGRIHAVERLEPATEEIRRWLLTEGVRNDVMPAYSALTCWQKSGAEKVLAGHPSYEEFTGIREILEGLLDEGPVAGISAVENGEAAVRSFLDHFQRLSDRLTLKDYEAVHGIRTYYSNRQGERCPIAMTCRKILTTYRCWCVLIDSLKEGKGADTAIDAGIDVKRYLLDYMKTSFQDAYSLCRYLAHDAEYRKELLKLYHENLPLEEMKTAPGTVLGLGSGYWRQSALEFLFRELKYYPCEGLEFVETGLQSEPVRTRNQALAVLESWAEKEAKPLAELLPEVQALLQRLQELEPDGDVKDRMGGLLSGRTVFQEEIPVFQEAAPFSEETLGILADAISGIGSWQWWLVEEEDDMVQLEFCDVQLYDDTKPEKGPHSSAIALRFYGRSFAALLDDLEEEGKPWYEKLHDDEIPPFPLEGFQLKFNDAGFVNQVFDRYKHKTPVKDLPEEAIVSSNYILAGKCHEVGFVAGGEELEVVGRRGSFTADEIESFSRRWEEYWKDYWRRRSTGEAYEKDRACELTIPADRKNP